MKTRQASLAPVGLAVLLALAASPAGAQEAMSTDTAVLSTESTMSSTSLATSTAWLVKIKGTVSGRPESVSFSGQAHIDSRLVRDPDFGNPSLLLTLDLNDVSGVGSSTRAKYVIPSREVVTRRLVASDRIEITFPFMRSGSTDVSSVRAGVASFALDFDTNTGAVTSGSGSVSSPAF